MCKDNSVECAKTMDCGPGCNCEEKQTVEQEIVSKGLTAPRITPDHIKSVIVDEKFIKATDVLTICVLTLRNGFTVTGESACASPENYNQEIGERIALENAIVKIWSIEGYLLKEKLYQGAVTNQAGL